MCEGLVVRKKHDKTERAFVAVIDDGGVAIRDEPAPFHAERAFIPQAVERRRLDEGEQRDRMENESRPIRLDRGVLKMNPVRHMGETDVRLSPQKPHLRETKERL